jgi:phosphate binding protein
MDGFFSSDLLLFPLLSLISTIINRMKQLAVLSLILVLLVSCTAPQTGSSATPIPVSNIQNKGSDTIVNLALAWAEAYQVIHPEVRLSVTGGGSGTGIAALINNTVDIANASRQIKPEELAEAQSKGIDPIEHVIARDAIAVIVNPENPVNQLTLQQISDIYSGKISNWQEVGGQDRPIARDQLRHPCLFPRNRPASGRERQQDPLFDRYPAAGFF